MSQNPVGGTTVTYLGKVSTPEPRILTMGTQSAINPSSVKVRVAKILPLSYFILASHDNDMFTTGDQHR